MIEVAPFATDKPAINGIDVVPSVIANVTAAAPPDVFYTLKTHTSNTSKSAVTGLTSAGVPESPIAVSEIAERPGWGSFPF